MPHKLLLSFLVVCTSLISCWAQANAPSVLEGGIAGTILTEDGQAASGAQPCVSMHSGNHTGITCPNKSDTEGRFTINHLKAGTYQVFAINDAEGYSMESQSPGQDVTLSADQPWATITIRMRNRGAILVGSITDKFTGKRIARAQIQYTAIDRNGSGGSTLVKDEFHVAVPPNCDVVVIVMANGYKGWVYTDGASPSRPVLRLASGERKEMNIQLEPLPDGSAPR